MNTDSSELDEILEQLLWATEHSNYAGASIAKKTAKSQILSRYRSVEDIKKAVGEKEMPSTYKGVANFNDETNKEILTRNRFRKEILEALKIGDENNG